MKIPLRVEGGRGRWDGEEILTNGMGMGWLGC